MKNLKKYFSNSYPILAVLLSLPATLALLPQGFFGASDEVHIAWLYEMDRALKMGQFPPRFVPDLSYGFGYPLFNFVFPLPYLVGEVFHLLGFSLVDSIKLVFFLSIPLAALFMFFLLKTLTTKNLSLLGAVLYSYAPYRSVDIYVRGAIGEVLSFVFFPLISLAVLKLTEGQKEINWRWIGIGGLSLSGLILTHNIAAYMFLPFAVFLAGLKFWRCKTNRLNILKQLLYTFSLGLIISAYFWLPALLDSSLVKYDTVFNFVDHFPTLKQLFMPYWGYEAIVPGPGDGISFFLGSSSVLILSTGVLLTAYFWKKFSDNQKIILIWTVGSIMVSILMMNYRAIFIWKSVPLIPFFQFPWRFLMMTTFLIPLLVLTLEKVRFEKILVSVLIVLTIFVNYQYFRPQDFLGRTDSYFLNKYIPIPKASNVYNAQQEEYLRLPKDTQVRPDRNYPEIEITGVTPQNVTSTNDLSISLQTSSDKPLNLTYYKYNFPGWTAKIDNKSTVITPGSPFGQITVKIPSGNHRTQIYFSETNIKLFLDILSLAGLVLAFLLIFRYKYINE